MANDAFRIEDIPESAGPPPPLPHPSAEKLSFYFAETQAIGPQVTFRLCEFGPITEDPNRTTLSGFIRPRIGLLDQTLMTRLKTEAAVLSNNASEPAQAMLASAYGLNTKNQQTAADLFRDELAGTNRIRPAVGHRWLLEPGPAGLPHEGKVSKAADYVQRCAPMSGHVLIGGRWIEDPDLGNKTYRQLLESDYTGKVILLVPQNPGAFVDCTVPLYLRMKDGSSRASEPLTVTLFAALDTPTASLIQYARGVAARYLLSSQDLQELASKQCATVRTNHAKLSGPSPQDNEGIDGQRALESLIPRSQNHHVISFAGRETAQRLYEEYDKARRQKKDDPHTPPESFTLTFHSAGSLLALEELPAVVA